MFPPCAIKTLEFSHQIRDQELFLGGGCGYLGRLSSKVLKSNETLPLVQKDQSTGKQGKCAHFLNLPLLGHV